MIAQINYYQQLIAGVLLLATCGCQPSSATSKNALLQADPELLVERGKIQFIADSTIGLRLAKQQSLPCLLFFTADWCTFCHQMEETAFADRVVGKLAQQFVCVLVDADQEPGICQQYAIEGFPTVQFIAADGRRLQRLIGRQSTQQLVSGMQSALERLAWQENADSIRR